MSGRETTIAAWWRRGVPWREGLNLEVVVVGRGWVWSIVLGTALCARIAHGVIYGGLASLSIVVTIW